MIVCLGPHINELFYLISKSQLVIAIFTPHFTYLLQLNKCIAFHHQQV